MVEMLVLVGVALALLLLFGLVLARLYRRSTREVSLVKTGSGGKKVIMDGGTVAIPLLHEISYVNMKTLRLEVLRAGDAAMIAGLVHDLDGLPLAIELAAAQMRHRPARAGGAP